jgi:hypothetical protein
MVFILSENEWDNVRGATGAVSSASPLANSILATKHSIFIAQAGEEGGAGPWLDADLHPKAYTVERAIARDLAFWPSVSLILRSLSVFLS